jgi:hypothetical protein
MSNKKQTAVEWLVNKLNNDFENNDFLISYANEISQAKELEKQQIIDARLTAPSELITYSKTTYLDEAEQYYNETFKQL